MEVRLKIKSTIYDLSFSNIPHADNGTVSQDDGCQEIEYSVSGIYEEENGKVKITYKEPEEMGIENTHTILGFSPAKRNALTMVRSGDMSASFRFDMDEKRQMCSYETPFMPMEFAVNTKKVANNVKNGKGAILLDYMIEIRGVNAERNRIFIEVRPV